MNDTLPAVSGTMLRPPRVASPAASHSDVVVRVEGLWKEYRLGTINHGTLKADLASWWARVRGKDDPNVKVDQFGGSNPADALSDDRFWALRDISFDVKQGEVLGIIGKNGAGKSTLLKILSRVTTPTRGEIKLKGRVASLLEVGTGFHPELTGRENIFLNGAILGMTKAEIGKKMDEIIAFAEVERFVDTPVKRYSSGMYVRLAFAVAAHLEPEILVVDEVLAVGDADFQNKCIGKLSAVAKEGRTILFVSHNMIAVERLCGRAVLLKGGRVETIAPTRDVVAMYLDVNDRHSDSIDSLPRGYVYWRPHLEVSEQFGITGIQLIDPDGLPTGRIGTWDEVRIRIHYEARRAVARGSVMLFVSTPEGALVTRTSTSPDQTLAMSFTPGSGFADCVFYRWPLAAGTYLLGAGLAIPGIEPLCRNDNLCSVTVEKRDVYRSGLAPSAERYLVASDHRWQLPDRDGGI